MSSHPYVKNINYCLNQWGRQVSVNLRNYFLRFDHRRLTQKPAGWIKIQKQPCSEKIRVFVVERIAVM